MTYKKDWFKHAYYSYEMVPEDNVSHVTFTFPNAAKGKLTFKTWLYKYKDGKQVAKNLEAEMLQCYIDRDLLITDYWKKNIVKLDDMEELA